MRNRPDKPLAIRNGLAIYSRLKAKTKMKVTSKKQRAKNSILNKHRKELSVASMGLCQNCGNPPDFRGLSVHHKTFRSQGGDNEMDNLIMVCGDCHDKFHRIG